MRRRARQGSGLLAEPLRPAPPAGVRSGRPRRAARRLGLGVVRRTRRYSTGSRSRCRQGEVTALIGPSGCGKSTFLRILNRMHELVPVGVARRRGAARRSGHLRPDPSVTEARRHIGMVFQKPNPFPAMSIYDNVLAGLKLTGVRRERGRRTNSSRSRLTKAGLWNEVAIGCAARWRAVRRSAAAAVHRSFARRRPRVLLMDEPCSALDPTSTRAHRGDHAELAKA